MGLATAFQGRGYIKTSTYRARPPSTVRIGTITSALENRQTCKRLVGSNPTPSATYPTITSGGSLRLTGSFGVTGCSLERPNVRSGQVLVS